MLDLGPEGGTGEISQLGPGREVRKPQRAIAMRRYGAGGVCFHLKGAVTKNYCQTLIMWRSNMMAMEIKNTYGIISNVLNMDLNLYVCAYIHIFIFIHIFTHTYM